MAVEDDADPRFRSPVADTSVDPEPMKIIPIPSINPPAIPSFSPGEAKKGVRAIVSLIWPYSSSTGSLALLLAEPDARLRGKKGQVRVEFRDSTAQATAKTRVQIGDEVLLGLDGCQFIEAKSSAIDVSHQVDIPQELVGGIRTPGKCVDWELVFSSRLFMKISRQGAQVTTLDIDQSPGRGGTPHAPVQSPDISGIFSRQHAELGVGVWDSPAFLKQTRNTNGRYWSSKFDLFDGSDGFNESPPGKRRRLTFDRNEWRYTDRSPSPQRALSNDTASAVGDHGIGDNRSRDVTSFDGSSDDAEERNTPFRWSQGAQQPDERSGILPEGSSTQRLEIRTSNNDPVPFSSIQRAQPTKDDKRTDFPEVVGEYPVPKLDSQQHTIIADKTPSQEDRQPKSPSKISPQVTASGLGEDVFSVHRLPSSPNVVQSSSSTPSSNVMAEGNVQTTSAECSTGPIPSTRLPSLGSNGIDRAELDLFEPRREPRMPPPALSPLRIPPPRPESGIISSVSEDHVPLKPTLAPVPSPSLPLPSPFPGQAQIGNSYFDHSLGSIDEAVLPLDQGLMTPLQQQSTHADEKEDTMQMAPRKDTDMVESARPDRYHPTSTPTSHHVSAISPPKSSAAVIIDLGSDESDVEDEPEDHLEIPGSAATEDWHKATSDGPQPAGPPGDVATAPSQRELETVFSNDSVAAVAGVSVRARSTSRTSKESPIPLGEEEDFDVKDKAAESALPLGSIIKDSEDSYDSQSISTVVPSSPSGRPSSPLAPFPEHLEQIAQIPSSPTEIPKGDDGNGELDVGDVIDEEEFFSFIPSRDLPAEESATPKAPFAEVPTEATMSEVDLSEVALPEAETSESEADDGTAPEKSSPEDMTSGPLASKTSPPENEASNEPPNFELPTLKDFIPREPISKPPTLKEYSHDGILERSVVEEPASEEPALEAPISEPSAIEGALREESAPEVAELNKTALEEMASEVLVSQEPVLMPSSEAAISVEAAPEATVLSDAEVSYPEFHLDEPPASQQASDLETSLDLYPSLPVIGQDSQLLTPLASQVPDRLTAASSPPTAILQQKPTNATEPVTPQATQKSKVSIDVEMTPRIHPPSSQVEETPVDRRLRRSRQSDVPGVLSPWFTTPTKPILPSQQSDVSLGLRTNHSYYAPLSTLSSYLNLPPTGAGKQHVDVIAVVTRDSRKPLRAASGRRDWQTIFSISDPSLHDSNTDPGSQRLDIAQRQSTVHVIFHRGSKYALPIARKGDVVLLRSFAVASHKGAFQLLSGDESAWAVWVEQETKGTSSVGPVDGDGPQVKGPPVEFGNEEEAKVEALRLWWQDKAETEMNGTD